MHRSQVSLEEAKSLAEQHEREGVCCNHDCNQGRNCPVRNRRAAQAGAGPRAYWRWPMGIGAHAIALCALAAAAALGYWLTR